METVRAAQIYAAVLLLALGSALSSRADEAPTPISDALIKPVAEWTGTLVLPSLSQRRPDGGIYIQLKNTPIPELQGKTVWMSYGESPSVSIEAQQYYREFMDVNFTQAAFDGIKQNFLQLDAGVNGWKQVSPLESLAAALPSGQMMVSLDTPEWDGSELVIHSEPVQISGSEMIYVRFDRTLSPSEFEVSHYNPAEKDFSGQTSVIRVSYPASLHDDHMTQSVRWSGIENLPQNAQGWLVYGDRQSDGTFSAVSAEPTSLFSANEGYNEISDPNKMLDFFNYQHWGIRHPNLQGQERKTAIEFGGQTPADIAQMGTKFLVIHSFGGNKSINKDQIGPLSFYSGHFAYGVATVIPQPFTGEPMFDIVYNQIYASNANGVVAGRIAYHRYNDTQRETNVVRPVSDVLVPLPELFHVYHLDGETLDPESLIQTQFSLMQALYRIGAGTGITTVEPYTSCVQDSTQVLLNGIWTLRQMSQEDPLKSWIDKNAKNPEVVLFKSLLAWADHANEKLGGGYNFFDLLTGIQSHSYLPAAMRNSSNVNAMDFVLLTLRTFSTAFPRATQDNLIAGILEMRRSMLLLDTFNTFGLDSAYQPFEPQILIGVSQVSPVNFPNACSDPQPDSFDEPCDN